MSEQALRNRLIRLAHANPKLRPYLLPLLTKQAGKIPPQFLENVNKAKAKAKKDDGKGKKKDDKNDFFEKMKAKKDDKNDKNDKGKGKGKPLSKEDFLAKMEAGKNKKKAQRVL